MQETCLFKNTDWSLDILSNSLPDWEEFPSLDSVLMEKLHEACNCLTSETREQVPSRESRRGFHSHPLCV